MENENKERKKIRNFIKVRESISKMRSLIKVNKPVAITVTVLLCLVLVGVSYTVYAKYYKTGYNKGMATASGFYFNSNYMASVKELVDITKPDSEIDISNIPNNILRTIIVSANPTPWTSDEYFFTVEVRNYDNHLLYNDQDLNVEYEVNFLLLSDPNGDATYTVTNSQKDKEVELKWEDGKSTIATFQGSLPGGSVHEDAYTVNLTVKKADVYEPTNVLMVAYPIGPDYLRGTKAIAGIIHATHDEKEFSIERQFFTVTQEDTYTANDYEKWGEAVLNESGYVYRVYTSGNFSGEGSATRRTIMVMWRDDMYKINEFDEYYQKIKELGAEEKAARYYTEERKDNPDDPSSGTHTWRIMKVDVLPYSSLSFTFYRNDNFKTELDSMIANVTDGAGRIEFQNSVRVEEVKEDMTTP